MTGLHFKLACIILVFLTKLNISSALKQAFLKEFDTRKSMVTFSPHVSVLDKFNNSRYRIAGLVPLVAKVATRFQKIHIKLDVGSYNAHRKKKSLWKSPLAIARYNCLPTTVNKVELFIEIVHTNIACECNKTEFYEKLYPAIVVAEKANAVCTATVSTLLLNKDHSCHSRPCTLADKNSKDVTEIMKLRFNFSWGLSMSFKRYCDGVIDNLRRHMDLDILLIYYKNIEEYSKQNSVNCKSYHEGNSMKKPLRFIKSLASSELERISRINMSSLEATWTTMLQYPSNIYLISYAFDEFSTNLDSTCGWWYLLKDPGNSNTSEFVFEEKITVADRIDYEENPKNFDWLRNKNVLNDNTTGVVSLRQIDRWDYYYDYFDYPGFLFFCRILTIRENGGQGITMNFNRIYKRVNAKACPSGRMLYSLEVLSSIQNSSTRNANARIYYTSGYYNVTVYSIKEPNVTIQYGYAYPLEICSQINKTSGKSNILDTILDPNIATLIFYFHEDERSVELGATRLVRQRIVLFENCKKFVQNIQGNSLKNIEIAFVSLGYFMVDKFYRSAVAMQQYIKYVYLLNNWATTQTNIIVFIGQFEDTKPHYYFNLEPQMLVGFYSYSQQTRQYSPKSIEALELSRLHYPERIQIDKNVESPNSNSFNISQFFITFCSLFVTGAFITILATKLIRRYYKNTDLNDDKIEAFYKGDSSGDRDCQKAPYDKEKYEIDDQHFKIQSDVPLGLGEFGAVYRGTITIASREIQAAVKMSNPQKFHKTQLTSLLSEIKLLAYIDKHENITELLAANTGSLKKGKVYIFLEFCHLGSLKRFLQEMRLLVSSPATQTDSETITNNYVNASATDMHLLDTGLSDDLYRWSTEICNGMSFLAEKHVVHADLATRNVLLNLRRQAKICDFGLSRRMYNYTNYVKTQQEPLPWKWMAPEALRDSEFNEKTDVWAFGVLLWEIYSLGCTPYAGLSWDANFSLMLDRGLRLNKPEYSERDMYARMQTCWMIHPENRPKFSEILAILQAPRDNRENKEDL